MALDLYTNKEIPTSTKFNAMVNQVNTNTTALQSTITTEDFTDAEDIIPYTSIATTINSSSTDAQVASAKAVYNVTNNKVDKVTGKGLSTNDYTDAEKTKVASALTQHQDISNKADKVSVTNETATTIASLTPNVLHRWSEVSSLTITALATPSDSTKYNEYMIEFVSGSTATSLNMPASITWMGDSAPTINANKSYQISIVNNLAVIGEF